MFLQQKYWNSIEVDEKNWKFSTFKLWNALENFKSLPLTSLHFQSRLV